MEKNWSFGVTWWFGGGFVQFSQNSLKKFYFWSFRKNEEK
jgi:hypothetical protein